MNTKALYAAIAVIALLIVGLLVYNQSSDQNQVASNTSNANVAASENDNLNNGNEQSVLNSNTTLNVNGDSNPPANVEGRFSDESDIQSPDVQVYEIKFDGTKFSPSTLDIKNGDIVVFKNESTKSFWPASAPHPQHTNYPEFDAKKALAPGETFQFKFTKTGSWGFHDHLTPTAFGKINVQ